MSWCCCVVRRCGLLFSNVGVVVMRLVVKMVVWLCGCCVMMVCCVGFMRYW